MVKMRVPPDFSEFLKLLARHEVEYLLIGGYAVAYHGFPRTTLDMDIWIRVEPLNAEKMTRVFLDFGFEPGSVSSALFLRSETLRIGVPPLRLEILKEISGVDFDTCYRDRLRVEVEGTPIDLISLTDLRANKHASGRPKDLMDLEHLPLAE